jgi:hypothetical protein
MTKEKKYIIAFFSLFLISCLFFFDVVRIDMEDKSRLFPVYESGQPAEMGTIEEKLGAVQVALCSSSKSGEKAVKAHGLIILRKQADDMGGNGVVDVTTDYGPHKDIDENCGYGVFVSGNAVVFAE